MHLQRWKASGLNASPAHQQKLLRTTQGEPLPLSMTAALASGLRTGIWSACRHHPAASPRPPQADS